MGFRTTGILAAVLVALLGYLYFFEDSRQEELQDGSALEKVLQMGKEQVARLNLRHGDLDLVAERRGNNWFILEPVRTPGDWSELEGMIVVAQDVDKGRVVVDSAEVAAGEIDLAHFGLAPPQVEVRFEPVAGDPVVLLLGGKAPSGKAAYLWDSRKSEVVLTQTWQKAKFERSLLDLRDKRLIPFDPDRVQKLVIVSEGSEVVARKEGFQWYLEKPIQDRGDDAALLGLVNRLKSGRAVDVVAEQAPNLRPYGLDTPWLKVSVFEDQGQSLVEKTVIFGDIVSGPGHRAGNRYGKYGEWPHIFAAERFIFEDLKAPPGAFRHKEIFTFERNGIDRVVLVYPDSTVDCRQRTAELWDVHLPPGYTIKAREVQNLIDRVYNMRVLRFLDDADADSGQYGLDQPVLRARLFRGETLVREVVMGKKDNRVFVQSDNNREIVEMAYDAPSKLGLRLVPVPKGLKTAVSQSASE